MPSSLAIFTSLRTPGALLVFGPSITMNTSDLDIALCALSSHSLSGAGSFNEKSDTSNGESGFFACPMMKSFKVLSLSKSQLINTFFFAIGSSSLLFQPLIAIHTGLSDTMNLLQTHRFQQCSHQDPFIQIGIISIKTPPTWIESRLRRAF